MTELDEKGFPITTTAVDEYRLGEEAGLRGDPLPDDRPIVKTGWLHGSTKRRVNAKQVVGVFGNATYCTRCETSTYGLRLGCRCNTTLEDMTIQYGFYIDDGLAPGEPMKYLSFEDAKKLTIPLVDVSTGLPILAVVE